MIDRLFFKVFMVAILFFQYNNLDAQQGSTPLYIISDPEDFGPLGKKRMFQPDIGHVRIVYHHEVDPDNDGKVNYDVLRAAIDLKVPNRNETGYCILDWEGPQFEFLKFSAIDEDSMAAIISKFRTMLSFARKLRPKAKWGIYDMPVTTYWVNQDTTWGRRSAIIQPLVQDCDVLAPCLYDYYQTGSYGWMDDSAYIDVTIKRSLEMGRKFNKPVLPFIWHRYHNATERVGFQCIDEAEFYNQVKQIAQTKIGSRRVDGVVWWQEDMYYYQIGEPQFLKEAAGRSKNAYLDDVTLKYLGVIKKALAN